VNFWGFEETSKSDPETKKLPNNLKIKRTKTFAQLHGGLDFPAKSGCRF